MKLLAVLPLVLFGASAWAQSVEVSSTSAFPAHQAEPWSVVGKWLCTQPEWTDVVTISADGTFSRTQGEPTPAGQWSLGGVHDRVILILAWKNWMTQTVEMVGPDEFRGRVGAEAPFGEMVMRRIVPPTGASVPSVETRAWHQGEVPLRLIRKEDGFCALSLVTGHFAGGGEVVKVYVGDDGYWYLGGDSHQNDVSAECIVVRFR